MDDGSTIVLNWAVVHGLVINGRQAHQRTTG